MLISAIQQSDSVIHVYTFLYSFPLWFIIEFLKINVFIYLSIYFWLRWVFVAVHGLSLDAASGGYSLLRCTGFSLQWFLLLWSTGSRRTGSVVVACGL